ncbi:hypothetical protein [Bacillus salipaludis]|uniref:Uncharacterized protein n=1 Tax=Bacillus salipaludis TaxID=2547811 RepID=A0ABW8RPP0_9BACI
MSDKEFEEYFKKKLEEEQENIKNLPYSLKQLREIYQQEFEIRKKMPVLELKMQPQEITYDLINQYIPDSWEMVRPGKLLYDEDELLSVLKIILLDFRALHFQL